MAYVLKLFTEAMLSLFNILQTSVLLDISSINKVESTIIKSHSIARSWDDNQSTFFWFYKVNIEMASKKYRGFTEKNIRIKRHNMLYTEL